MKYIFLLLLGLLMTSCLDEELPELGTTVLERLDGPSISGGSARFEDYSTNQVNAYVSFSTFYSQLEPDARVLVESLIVIKPDRTFTLDPDRRSFFDGQIRRNRERCYSLYFVLVSGERLDTHTFCITTPE